MLRTSLLLIYFFSFSIVFGQSSSTPGAAESSPGLGFYSEKDLWGIESKRSRPVTPPLYDTLVNTSGPYVLAKKWITSKQARLWGTLNAEGKQVIPFKYMSLEEHEQVYIFSDRYQNLIHYGLLDESGKILANSAFDKITYVGPNRFAAVKSQKTKLLDRSGAVLASFASDSVRMLKPGVIQVWLNGKSGLVNGNGLTIADLKYSGFKPGDSDIKAIPFPKWTIVSGVDSMSYSYEHLMAWGQNYIVGNSTQYWLINATDSALSKGYNRIIPQSESIALVKNGSRFGAINSNGQQIIAPVYNSLVYQDGYFIASRGSSKQHYSLIDSYGVIKSSFDYEKIELSSEGRYPVLRKGKWGFIDSYGVEIISAVYDSVSKFEDGHSKVSFLGENGVIDLNGSWILKPRNEQIIQLYDSSYLGSSYNLNFLKDLNGEYIYFTSNKLLPGSGLILEVDSSDQIINRISLDGTFVYRSEKYEPQYGEAEGLAIIKKDGKYGMVDVNGNLFIAYRYDSLLTFSEGFAAMMINKRWGYIDRLERIVIQPQFDWAGQFRNGHALFGKNGKTGVINQKGTIIIRPIHEEISMNAAGLYIVKTNNKYGLLDPTGAAIIHPRFEKLELLPSGDMIAKRNGRYTIIDVEGVTKTLQRFLLISYDKKSGSLSFKQPASQARIVYRF